jgi:hypothetical protein
MYVSKDSMWWRILKKFTKFFTSKLGPGQQHTLSTVPWKRFSRTEIWRANKTKRKSPIMLIAKPSHLSLFREDGRVHACGWEKEAQFFTFGPLYCLFDQQTKALEFVRPLVSYLLEQSFSFISLYKLTACSLGLKISGWKYCWLIYVREKHCWLAENKQLKAQANMLHPLHPSLFNYYYYAGGRM